MNGNNGKIKQATSMLLMFLLILCIAGTSLTIAPVKVWAMTTQSEAVQWARNQEGSTYQNGYGIQCIELFRAYCTHIGLGFPTNWFCPKDLPSQAYIPEGWSKLAGVDVQPGDVAVWTGGSYAEYGHVAIVLSVNGNSFEVIDQNGQGGNEPGTIRTKYYGDGYWGVLRPNFSPEPPSVPQGSEIAGGGRTVSDGDYYIASALTGTSLNPGPSCLTISGLPGAENDDYANAQLWPVFGQKEHVFTVTWLGNGFYKIKLKGSASKCLDVAGGDTARGANVQQYIDYGSTAQQWRLDETGDGYGYTIRPRCSGWFLDVENGSTDAGTNVRLWEGNGSNAQRWFFVPWSGSGSDQLDIPDGDYEILAKPDGSKALHAEENGSNVELDTRGGDGKQVFRVTNLGNGYHKIIHKNSGLSLDVADGKSVNGANVQLCGQSEGTNHAQQWFIRPCGNGYYNIISKLDGLYLDLADAKTDNGTNVQMYVGWEINGADCQQWRFVPWGESVGRTIEDGEYQIVPFIEENKVLGVEGDNMESGANLAITSHKGDEKHTFDIVYLGDGYYSMLNRHSGLSLDNGGGPDGAYKCGANAWLWKPNDGYAQQWMIRPCGDGYYNIISRCTGLCLDVSDGNPADGTNVWMWMNNQTDAQKWKLIPYERKVEVEKLALDKNAIVLAVGTRVSLSAEITPENATDKTLMWKCSDPLVADVDGNGVVTAKSAGTATITVTASNRKTASCAVTVTGNAEGDNGGKDNPGGGQDDKNQKPGSCQHTYGTSIVPATMSADGSITKTCSKCGDIISTPVYAIKSVGLSQTSYVYNGKSQKPSVTVKDSHGKTLTAGTDYVTTYPKGRKNVGRYAVKISFRGNYDGAVKKKFTITPKPARLSKVKPMRKGFAVKWKKQPSQITGYEIAYSTAEKFTKKATRTIRVNKNKTSRTVSKLKSRKYYVRIRTYKKTTVGGKKTTLYSGWSKVKTVRTKK